MKRKSQQYETATGKTVELVAVPYYKIQAIVNGIEKEMRAEGKPLDPPTYETELPGGEIQVHEHYRDVDPKTGEISTSLETEDELAAWEAYLAAQRELQNRSAFPTLRYLLRNGIKADLEADETWEDEQRFDGIEIPTDPREKYFHYLLTEVITTPAEQKEVSEIIMIASMSGDAETEQAVKDLFRG